MWRRKGWEETKPKANIGWYTRVKREDVEFLYNCGVEAGASAMWIAVVGVFSEMGLTLEVKEEPNATELP